MNWIARHRRLVLGAYILVLLGVTLAPLPSTKEVVEIFPYLDRVVDVLDKIVHAALFGGLAFLFLWNLGWSDRRGVVLRAVVLALTGAALVELLQSPLPYRHGDFLDFATGGVGAVAVAIVVVVLLRKRSRQAGPHDA
ncbi:MAG: VanZ family protein [Gemmatimonadota bacterium]|nr:MAG: VanZ family protein [Gemmatimonadota bacterium]